MSLIEIIEADIKKALKEKNDVRLRTTRLLKTEIVKEATTTKNAGKPFLDPQVINVLRKVVKRHQDSIAAFTTASRSEQVKQETEEMNVVLEYLPKELTNEEIDTLIDKATAEIGEVTKKEASSVVRKVTELSGGAASGKVVFDRVSLKLK